MDTDPSIDSPEFGHTFHKSSSSLVLSRCIVALEELEPGVHVPYFDRPRDMSGFSTKGDVMGLLSVSFFGFLALPNGSAPYPLLRPIHLVEK
jgi:hypothetical protein